MGGEGVAASSFPRSGGGLTIVEVLVVEFFPVPGQEPVRQYTLTSARWPEATPAVHNGYLGIIDPKAGEIAGYAAGIWRRWWYQDEEPAVDATGPT